MAWILCSFYPFLLLLLREKERSESGKGKFKKLSRLLVSYQEADPAELEEDAPTPALHSFREPPTILYLYTITIHTVLNITICQALFGTNIPQCPHLQI